MTSYSKCDGAKNNWFGFCIGPCTGTISTTLKKCGNAILKFGNCYSSDYVVAKLNGKEIARANTYESKYIVFAFKDGDILELTEGYAVLEFEDLNIISCSTC